MATTQSGLLMLSRSRDVPFNSIQRILSAGIVSESHARGLANSETEHSYRRAIELDPQFAVAYAHLARMLNRAGRGTESIPFYEKASGSY